jgi:hypothetical protein
MGLRLFPNPSRCIQGDPISFVRLMDSWSAKVNNVYSVPVSGFRAWIRLSVLERDRGVLRRFTSTSAASSRCVASASLCSAPAKRETASAAPFFADTISASKESASVLAPLATLTVLETANDAAFADPLALADKLAAPCARSCALFASILACAADAPASRRRVMFMDWIFSSSVFTLPSTQNSPATPIETISHPTMPTMVSQYGACSLVGFSLHRFTALMISYTSFGPSRMTPIATNFVTNRRLEKSGVRELEDARDGWQNIGLASVPK